MPVTPDAFIHRNPFDSAYGPAAPPYDHEGLSLDLIAERADLALPLTTYPTPGAGGYLYSDLASDRCRIIDMFHRAVRGKQSELVTDMVRRGIVSPDVPNSTGATPLTIAIETSNTYMTKLLLDLGADVDRPSLHEQTRHHLPILTRTPLMVAAAQGHLVLVKLLMESGADDSIVAPDGQIALRLAADAGHREIVELLPARRAGAFLRWKTYNARVFRGIRKFGSALLALAKVLLWYLPKWLVWDVPTETVKAISKKAAWAWKNRGRFGGWVKRQVAAVPKLCRAVVTGITRIPRAVVDLSKWLWRSVAAIPGAVAVVAKWVWTSICGVSQALGAVLASSLSLVHTVITALVDRFKSVTLKDVLAAIMAIPHALFVNLPLTVWSGIAAFGKVSYNVLAGVFGTLGVVVWYICWVLGEALLWIPKGVSHALIRLASSAVKAGHEVMVFVNPKH